MAAPENAMPIPIGVTVSFPNVQKGVNTSTFSLDAGGDYLVTFQPVDADNTGTLILYDSTNTAVLTMTDALGYGTLYVGKAASGYYFTAANGARMAAITKPSCWR